jgi:hypothetical protein
MPDFYAISSTQAALTGLSATNLSTDPHPTTFNEEFEHKVSGDGNVVALGFANCIWTYDTPLTPSEWDELMTYVGTAASAPVFMRTRTNQIVASEYEHQNYSAIMHRPTGNSVPYFRFEDVEIRFSRMVLLT